MLISLIEKKYVITERMISIRPILNQMKEDHIIIWKILPVLDMNWKCFLICLPPGHTSRPL